MRTQLHTTQQLGHNNITTTNHHRTIIPFSRSAVLHAPLMWIRSGAFGLRKKADILQKEFWGCYLYPPSCEGIAKMVREELPWGGPATPSGWNSINNQRAGDFCVLCLVSFGVLSGDYWFLLPQGEAQPACNFYLRVRVHNNNIIILLLWVAEKRGGGKSTPC